MNHSIAASLSSLLPAPVLSVFHRLPRPKRAWIVPLIAIRLAVLAVLLLVATLWEGCVPLVADGVTGSDEGETEETVTDNGSDTLPGSDSGTDDGATDDGTDDDGNGQDDGHDNANDEEHDDGHDDTPGEPTDASLDLVAAEWIVLESQLTVDECGLSDSVDRGQPGATMDLVPTSTNSFELTFHEGGEVVDCGLTSDTAYECDTSYSTDDTPSTLGLNAMILVEINSEGQFHDNTTLSLESAVQLECEGANCGMVQLLLGSSFPCTMVMVSEMAVSGAGSSP